MRILVTRPERDAKATAARLVALGHEPLIAPLMRVVLDTEVGLPRDDVGALLVTSRNAADALAARADRETLLALPVFAVGDRTAAALRRAGFASVTSARGDRHALRAAVAAARLPADGRLLWPTGAERTGDLVGEFARDGYRVVSVEVYRAEPVDRLTPAAEAAFAAGTLDAVAVYSPRSAAILVERLAALGGPAASPGLGIHAISEAAAQPFREAGWTRLVVADRPDEDALMETCRRPPAPRPAPPLDDPGRQSMSSKVEKATGSAPEPDAPVAAPPGDATPETASTETSAPVDPIEAVDAADVAPAAPSETEADAAPPATDEPAAAEAPTDLSAAAPEPTPVAAVAPETAPDLAAPIAAPRRGGAAGLVAAAVVASLVGGGLGVAGSQWLAADRPVAAPSPAETEAAARLKALDGRLAALEQRIAGTVDLTPRLTAVETDLAARKPADLSAVEARLGAIEAAPALKLPTDLADRLSVLEKGAAERLEAAKTSVGDALAKLPEDTGAKAALAELAARVDAAVTAARETSAAEVARLAAELEAQKAELKARASATGEDLKSAVGDTAGRLAAEVEKRAAEVSTTVDGLRQRLSGLEGLRAEVDALIGRLGGLETSNKEAKADRGRIAETLDATRSLAEGRVGSVEQKLATLEAGADAARRAQAEAVFAVALADLKSAVDTGRPFAPELDVVRRAAPEGTTLALAALDPFLATGVPSVTALRDGLPRVVRAMHEAEEAVTAGPGPLDRLMAHAGRVVRVRPAGEAAGSDPGALISRVEGRMIVGDLPAALAAWKALPEPSRKASATWAAALEARVAVDAALAAQTAAVVAKLSQSRP